MSRKKLIIATILIMSTFVSYHCGRTAWYPLYMEAKGKRTISDVIREYAEDSFARLSPYFENADMAYPPLKITLVVIKDEKILELWGKNERNWRPIRSYPIHAASGKAGPKLREGDRQVPEGIYKIVGLNPNSSYHLSLKLDYPNAFDLKYAREEGRTQPGSDIFIHGRDVSIGCLAMGDEAIEELFVLVHQIGKENVNVIIMPYDFRKNPIEYAHAKDIRWLPVLYRNIDNELSQLESEL